MGPIYILMRRRPSATGVGVAGGIVRDLTVTYMRWMEAVRGHRMDIDIWTVTRVRWPPLDTPQCSCSQHDWQLVSSSDVCAARRESLEGREVESSTRVSITVSMYTVCMHVCDGEMRDLSFRIPGWHRHRHRVAYHASACLRSAISSGSTRTDK